MNRVLTAGMIANVHVMINFGGTTPIYEITIKDGKVVYDLNGI